MINRVFQLAIVLWLSAVALGQQPQVLDRLLAIVNNTPILQSDWEAALRCEAIMDGRTPESFTESEQQDVFRRLVDQELIREQMRGPGDVTVTEEEVDARISEVRRQIPAASTDKQWKELLDRDGLTESQVRARVRSQMEILRFLDARIRPLIRVEFRAIREYYRDQYVPELQKQGVQPAPLAEVVDKIREVITQQRIEEQTTAWVQTLREGADIRFPKPSTQEREDRESSR